MTRVVLCTSGGLYGALVLERLLRNPDLQIAGLVLSTRILHPSYGWLHGALAQLRRSGPVYTLYLGCATALADLAGGLAGLPPVTASARRHAIPLCRTRDINGAAGRSFVAELHPDLLLSAFFNQRIGAAVASIPPAGAVNIHPSLLPDDRGVDPVFHARLRGAGQFGVTLHRIADDFDTGPVMAQAPVPVAADASALVVTAQLFRRGTDLLIDALPRLLAGDPGQPQAPGGSYDSWPDPSQVRAYRAAGHRLVSLADLARLRAPRD